MDRALTDDMDIPDEYISHMSETSFSVSATRGLPDVVDLLCRHLHSGQQYLVCLPLSGVPHGHVPYAFSSCDVGGRQPSAILTAYADSLCHLATS